MENHSSVAKTRDALAKDAVKLKHDALQVAQDVREHASAHVDDVKQRMIETIQGAQEQLAAHPLKLLGVGFFVGFLFGLRFRR